MKINMQDVMNQNKKVADPMEAMQSYQTGDRVGKVNTSYGKKAVNAYELTLMSARDKSFSVGGSDWNTRKSGFLEGVENAANMNVDVMQDYMTVMSNTMSKEDYAEMSKDGFHFESMDAKEAVTIVDKIKAQVLLSGKQVAGFNDDLNDATLAQAVGSEGLARELEDQTLSDAVGSKELADTIQDEFDKADLPVTKENVEMVKVAWEMASRLAEPTDGSIYYMAENMLPPDIYSFYMAQSSGAGAGSVDHAGYYAEDIKGYLSQSAQVDAAGADEELIRQADKVLEQEGIAPNEEAKEASKWLLEKGLPLTGDHLRNVMDLKSVAFPISDQVFAQAVAGAIQEGTHPMYARLDGAENLYAKAQDSMDLILERVDASLADSSLTDATMRRRLEEVRLQMTAQVNIRLLKSGISIDTAPMEELIRGVEEAEKSIAKDYFPASKQPVEDYRTFTESAKIMEQIPTLPARALGLLTGGNLESVSVRQFHAHGSLMKAEYQQAMEHYEELMTAPRADLGDSIKKAFRNAEDILKEMGMEASEDKLRAVRILGYNSMEINEASIDEILTADASVRQMVERMTPAATLQMIRDGINPLEKSFEQLHQYFDEQPVSAEEEQQSYSRFLYNLERNGQITEEEKTSFIGIYRLIHQIEKKEDAAVGTLVNENANINFANLLSAVRSGKFGHMDVKVNDALGGLEDLIRKGESISDQINKGFAGARAGLEKAVETEETKQEFLDTKWQELKESGEFTKEETAMLLKSGMDLCSENLRATADIIHDKMLFAGRWKARLLKERHGLSNLLDSMDSETQFKEMYSAFMKEELEEATEEMYETAEKYLDVKEFHLLHRQMGIMSGLSDQDEYYLPMIVGEDLTKVHVIFKKDDEMKGNVSVSVDLDETQHIEAHFEVREDSIGGYFIGNSREEVMMLREISDIFSKSLESSRYEQLALGDLPIVGNAQAAALAGDYTMDGANKAGSPDNSQLYGIAKLFLEAVQLEKTR